MQFGYFVLDEAQNVKNLRSKVHSAAKKINAKNSLALTGTPIEQEHSLERQEILRGKIAPFMLRRTKEKVATELELLLELVEELLEEGRRILIFSQFTSMLSIIEEALMQREIPLSKLTGSTQNRDRVIEKFTSGEASVFLISLKAGGVGLNLTQADTVIHYDPWWNPAAEEQATDRAYRIGQDKPVFVYKLIIEDSVEEKILALQEQKKQLSNALYSEKEEGVSALDSESLLELFS